MLRLIPAPLARALLPLAHRVRHRWQRWRGAPLAGVSVIARDMHEDVLLVKHSYGPDAWSLPGGGLKSGEDPAAAAQREFREELGCEVQGLVAVGTLEEVISGCPHTAHIFSGRIDAMPQPDRREILEARFFPAHSLPQPLSAQATARLAAWRETMRGSK